MKARTYSVPTIGALVALLCFASCGGEGAGSNSADSPGKKFFIAELCASCHGFDRKGSWMGPPLTNLNEHWERHSLAEFIRTPTKFTSKDERIQKLSKQFRTQMAPNKRLSEENRLLLADWLLERSAAQ